MRFAFRRQESRVRITTPQTPYPWINYLGCEHSSRSSHNKVVATVFTSTLACVDLLDIAITTYPRTPVADIFYIREQDGSYWDAHVWSVKAP